MTHTAKALGDFFGGFSIPAYAEDAVPVGVKPPYITYTVPKPGAMGSAPVQARVWYAGASYLRLGMKVDEILDATQAGVLLVTGGGMIALYPGRPAAQIQPAGEGVRAMYLNFIMNDYQWEG